MGSNYSIRKVSSKSFFVYSKGKQTRYDLHEWKQWLLDRFAEGKLIYNGQELQAPLTLQYSNKSGIDDADQFARDQRFLRATKSILGKYKFIREDDDAQTVHFDVHGGERVYRVSVPRKENHRLSCSCPDAKRFTRSPDQFCKHLIAVLMSNEDLRFHLLEVLL